MKRGISISIVAAPALAVSLACAACSSPTHRAAETPATEAGWVVPPRIETAQRTATGLIVRGAAAPAGRVVLRGQGDTAFATNADDQGRFELQVAAPGADTLFVVETQNGQDASPAPYRMLVSRDPSGPIALLVPGSPTRRLDRAGGLDVIDSDGRALLASGRGQAGQTVQVSVDGRVVPARVGRDGRWVLSLGTASAASRISVGGRTYDYPGGGDVPASGLTLTPGPGGWIARWVLSSRSRQSAWFPNVGR